MHLGQSAVALADRGANRFDDYRFTHLSSPFLSGDTPGRWPLAPAGPRSRHVPRPSSARTASVCWPRPGHRPHRRIVTGDDRRRQQRLDRALGRLDLPPAVAGGQLRVNDDLARHVVARVADPGLVGHLLDVREIVLRTPGSDRLVEDLAVRAPAGVGGEPRVVGEVGAVDDLPGHPLPFAVVGGAEHDGLPVAGRKGAVGRDRGRAHAERLLVDAGVLGVGQLIAHHVGQHVEQAQDRLREPGPSRRSRENSSARIDSAA